MKKILAVAVLLLAPSLSSAQVFDPNLLFVFGAQYAKDAPAPELSRVQFLFSANAPGLKVVELFGQPLYVGGLGFDLRTVDEAVGDIKGFALTVPALTYHIKGGPVAFQVGATRDLTGEDKTIGFYAGVGTGVTTPREIAAKRAAKAAKKSAELLKSHPTPAS